MNTTTKIYIYVSTYRFRHGRPSGAGNWAFEIEKQTYFFSGMYSEAKKKAVAKAREIAKQKGLTSMMIDLLP